MRAVDCSSSRCTCRVSTSFRWVASCWIRWLEIQLCLASLPGYDVKATHGQRGGEQNTGYIRGGTAHQGDHQGPQADGTRLCQSGGRKRSLNLIGDRARFHLPIVAADHVPRYPADGVQQRLAVVVEARADIADHALAMAGDLTPLDVGADVLP